MPICELFRSLQKSILKGFSHSPAPNVFALLEIWNTSQSRLLFKMLKNRARWYQMMVALEDETTQRTGFVAIVIGSPNRKTRGVALKIHMLENGLPLRVVAVHVFLLSQRLNQVSRYILLALGKQIRLRIRLHMEGMHSIAN